MADFMDPEKKRSRTGFDPMTSNWKASSRDGPPPPSSLSLAAQEQQLAIIRDQEVTLLFQALVKKGNPDPLALSLAQEMAQDRYKTALAAAASVAMSNNAASERPNS